MSYTVVAHRLIDGETLEFKVWAGSMPGAAAEAEMALIPHNVESRYGEDDSFCVHSITRAM